MSSQVSELLVSAGLDPSKKDGDDKKEGEGGKADAAKQQAASTLEDIIRSKNDVISVLHGELRRVKELQLSLVSQYERKMALYALPADELGFKPIATTKKAAH